jgi:phosphoglycolate phosphatase-like HAD superfamily hydrolase
MAVLVALSGDPRWQQVSDAIEHHELSAVAASVPMPYLADALEATAPLRRAVVTLLPRRVAVSALTRHGIPIDHVIPRRPELRPKPAPDQVNAAVALLEVDRSALVMVGDSSWDEEASHAAGVAFIGLRNGGRSEFSPATPTVDHLGELVQLFQHRWYG